MFSYEIFNLEKFFTQDRYLAFKFGHCVKKISSMCPDICPDFRLRKVNIIFVTEQQIQQLNQEFRQKDAPTDVLSFLLDDDLGEVYVSPDYIRQYNLEFEQNPFIEILRMVIHGLLHLLGYEHSEHFDRIKDNTEEMFLIQENILDKVLRKCKMDKNMNNGDSRNFDISKIQLIVGLGNPGKEYENTPHNVGFMIIDDLYESLRKEGKVLSSWKFEKKFFADVAVATLNSSAKCFLIKPMSFMNLSGRAVRSVVNFYKIVPEEILVIHDDLDIQLGHFKLQYAKGPKRHNGVLDIERALGTTHFYRLRVGVATRLLNRMSGADYVISRLPEEDLIELSEVRDSVLKILLS